MRLVKIGEFRQITRFIITLHYRLVQARRLQLSTTGRNQCDAAGALARARAAAVSGAVVVAAKYVVTALSFEKKMEQTDEETPGTLFYAFRSGVIAAMHCRKA